MNGGFEAGSDPWTFTAGTGRATNYPHSGQALAYPDAGPALMAEGLTNGGIAKRLYVSERTLEAHVRHVFTKMALPETEDGHRRVLAVLTHLSASAR
jgi:hypothetical protein